MTRRKHTPQPPSWLTLFDVWDESCALEDTNGELESLRELIAPVSSRDPTIWPEEKYSATLAVTRVHGGWGGASGVMWSLRDDSNLPLAECYVTYAATAFRIGDSQPVSADDAKELFDVTTSVMLMIWGARDSFEEDIEDATNCA